MEGKKMYGMEDFRELIPNNEVRISLIDYNSLYPDNQNLALRKIKEFFQAEGNVIDFHLENPDVSIISQVFPDEITLPLESIGKPMIIGGSGHNVKITLPHEIEHTCPNCDGMGFSMGRTSWGCPRKCAFCMTWRMEGTVTKEHSPFEEFVRHDKLLLYDANFLASPKAVEKLESIVDNKWKVNFNQGLDVRLVTPEIAHLIAKTKTRDKDFIKNRMYFAWDRVDDQDDIIKGIDTLLDHGVKEWRLMFYVLTGFDSTIEQDIFRVKELIKRKIEPFVMVYNNRKDIPEIRHLARYVNRQFYNTKKENYKEGYGSLEEYIAKKMANREKYGEQEHSLEDWEGEIT